MAARCFTSPTSRFHDCESGENDAHPAERWPMDGLVSTAINRRDPHTRDCAARATIPHGAQPSTLKLAQRSLNGAPIFVSDRERRARSQAAGGASQSRSHRRMTCRSSRACMRASATGVRRANIAIARLSGCLSSIRVKRLFGQLAQLQPERLGDAGAVARIGAPTSHPRWVHEISSESRPQSTAAGTRQTSSWIIVNTWAWNSGFARIP